MREITIDFENCTYSQIAGYIGEHNATKVKVLKTADLSGSTFSLAFMTNSEIIHSRFFASGEEIEVDLWSQLTQDKSLHVQLESYGENGEYLGKSAVAKLVFLESLTGTDVIADTDNPDIYSDISSNTLMRETLKDNIDTLDKLSTSNSGKLLFNGKEIIGGVSGEGNGDDGFSPIVEVEAIDGGHRVTITDVDGEKSFDVLDGAKGDKGDDYVLTEADKTEIAEMTAEIIDTSLLNAIGSGVLE